MMRINGQLDSDESSGAEIDEMAENFNTSQIEKIEYLEKKILEQGDEIICLRSTLANVVRRLEQVEANSKTLPGNWAKYGNSARNGNSKISGPGEYAGMRLTNYGSHSNAKESVKRSLSTSNNAFLQRRQAHYQSTGSLHSGQSNNSEANSSNSESPVPMSPSPSTHSNSPGIYQRQISATSGIHSSRVGESNRNNTQSAAVKSSSNLHNSKRWSSTGDFVVHSQIPSPSQVSNFSRSSAKSLLNLFPPRHHSNSPFAQVNNQRKHGNNEIIYNEDEGLFRMYLRGRPVVVHIPSALIDAYDVNEIAKPPPERLKLDWVYGYRGRDCRSNLHYLPTGEMVYFVAAVVVLYNVEEQSQRHYLGHTDDVKCLAVHPNKMLVATGQCAGHDRLDSKPHIRVWNSVSLHTVAIIGVNEFEKSICCLTFSKVDGGALLCAIDESSDHTITVWDWQKKERSKVAENKCSVDTVIAAEFHPLDRHCIVTCGKTHIAFWILDQNGTLYKRMGLFENRDKPKYVTCLAFTQDGDTLSGDSNGNIFVWGRGTNTISKLIRGVHETAIFSICVLKDGTIITGGGKDRKLVMLNSEFYPVEEGCIAENYGGIRQISESKGSQLLIGTTKNCILIGSFAVGFTPAVIGHTEEIWGCAMHPNLPQFLTAGYDGIINVWDSLSHTILWTKDMMEQIQSVQFSPDGSVVVVGFINGKWCVLDGFRREILSMYQDGSEAIQDCKFSPDGTMLALGSRDNTIYIYQASENFTSFVKVGRCVGHSSFITHIDWSKDSQFLRSNSGDYELLYWQANICRQVTQSSSMRDVEWATNDCTITFETIGIWQDGMDGTDVNNCARSNNMKLLVTGDDYGKLKLYTYPVIYPKSLHHSGGGHSSHVTNVGFVNDDSRIVSIGGKDTSVMQWKVS